MPTLRALRPLVVAIATLALVLVGCADDPETEQSADDALDDSRSADDVAFPVTIEHAYGSTTIEKAPQRVVTVGFTDHDAVLALGVVPIGLRNWYGDHPEGVWPWAEDLLGDESPALLPAENLNFEQIAALEPDLILGLYVDLESDQYDTLSQIAPTVAQSGEHPAFGTPWQEMTMTAGTALGKVDDAQDLVDDVEETFADLREEHPEFAGVGLAYAGVYGEEQYYVETDGSTRMQILLDLGFVVPDQLAALGDDAFYHEISAERLDLLDQDVVLWEPADIDQIPAIEGNALYQSLSVAQDDREVFLDDPLVAGAMAHATVLSLPIVLDHLVPRLADAVTDLG